MKLTLIIPVFNSFESLKELQKCLERQDIGNVQLIVVDDGSTDELSGVSSRFLHHISHVGVSGARNYGLDLAEGEYTAFIDADDLVSEDFIDTVIKTIQTKQDVYQFMTKTEDGHEDYHQVPVWGKIYKTNLIKKLYFDENKQAGEDIEWTKRLLELKPTIEQVPKVIYQYRWSRNNNSLSKRHNRGELQ